MKVKFYLLFLLITGIFLQTCQTNSDGISTAKSDLITDSAMVVSAHPLASHVGARILKKGGNAIDAAIGVQFALSVVYPVAGNIGGGGFMVIRLQDGSTNTLDFREKAPGKASRNMYLDSLGNVIEGLSFLGHMAAGVPGTVAGMVEAHEKYGSLPWAELVQPSIDLAEEGFKLTESEARRLNRGRENFEKHNTILPDNILSDNEWEEGDKIYYKDLASTLTFIRDNKASGFYEGPVADLIVEEMERGNGIISREDLKNYEAVWRPALHGNYRDYTIITMPPPSSGGIALLQLLKSVEPYPLSEWGFHDQKAIHLIIEAERRVYADRATHLGDPDFWEVPIEEMVSEAYNFNRMISYSSDSATPSNDILAGIIPENPYEETTHFSIVDKFGNAVAVTTTLNGGFGNKVVVGKAGFFLNNEMDDFSIKPGFPNYYGLVGGEANAIQPGKRMLSSMTPSIIERGDSLYFVVGTPGGSTIITSVFQTILNVTDYGMNAQNAVNSKRFHHQWRPDSIFVEDESFDEKTIDWLTEKGHVIVSRGQIGRVDAIRINDSKKLEGGADYRGDDAAAGY